MSTDAEIIADMLARRGQCSQLIMALALKKLGITDETLCATMHKAMGGLGGGMGVRHACGILTSAAAAFSLADEKAGPGMFKEFYTWFYENYGEEHGGVTCAELLDGDHSKARTACPPMTQSAWEKMAAILQAHGFGQSA